MFIAGHNEHPGAVRRGGMILDKHLEVEFRPSEPRWSVVGPRVLETSRPNGVKPRVSFRSFVVALYKSIARVGSVCCGKCAIQQEALFQMALVCGVRRGMRIVSNHYNRFLQFTIERGEYVQDFFT